MKAATPKLSLSSAVSWAPASLPSSLSSSSAFAAAAISAVVNEKMKTTTVTMTTMEREGMSDSTRQGSGTDPEEGKLSFPILFKR